MLETLNKTRAKNKRKRAPQNGLQIAFGTYKRRSKQKGLKFDLSLEQFHQLTSENCFYCNQKPHNVCHGRYGGEAYTYSGIDRKNSDIGYVMSNSLPCCIFCNIFKNNFLSVDETKTLIQKLKEMRNVDESNGFRLRVQPGKRKA